MLGVADHCDVKTQQKISSVGKSTDGILPVQEAMHFKKIKCSLNFTFSKHMDSFFHFLPPDTHKKKKLTSLCPMLYIGKHQCCSCKRKSFTLTHLNFLHLHHWHQIFVKYTYTTPCKCFGSCYIPLMTIPYCKSILISCGCILHGSIYIYSVMGHFDWPFTKNYDTWAIGHY